MQRTAARARQLTSELSRAVRLLQTAAEHDDKQLIMYIDELQELVGARQIFGDPDRITKQLRTDLQTAPPRLTCLSNCSTAKDGRSTAGAAGTLWPPSPKPNGPKDCTPGSNRASTRSATPLCNTY